MYSKVRFLSIFPSRHSKYISVIHLLYTCQTLFIHLRFLTSGRKIIRNKQATRKFYQTGIENLRTYKYIMRSKEERKKKLKMYEALYFFFFFFSQICRFKDFFCELNFYHFLAQKFQENVIFKGNKLYIGNAASSPIDIMKCIKTIKVVFI